MNATSVVIPCFNAENWIGEALESVFLQNLPHLEVIVVDDGSTDGSYGLVRGSFAGVQLVRVSNGGPSRARNIGTQLASGEFIQYLDADDVLAPGKLQTQVEALKRSGADVVYGDWRELRPGPNSTYLDGRLVSRQIEGEADIALLTDFWCPPAAYLFRRAIVDRVGGWDEQQPIIEDVRLVLMCALYGARFTYASGLAASYRVHDDSLSKRDPVVFLRGCLRNAGTTEQWWLSNGGLTSPRKTALLRAYTHIARASFARDNETFETAYAALKRLNPNFVPDGPWHLSLTSRVFGYRSAEALALRYRRAKGVLLGR